MSYTVLFTVDFLYLEFIAISTSITVLRGGHESTIDLSKLAAGHLRVVCVGGYAGVLAEVVAAED